MPLGAFSPLTLNQAPSTKPKRATSPLSIFSRRGDGELERTIKRVRPDGSTTTNFLDLYKEGHFVLETKQGVNPRRDKSVLNQTLLKQIHDDLDQAVLEAYRGGAFQAPSQESFEALAGHLKSAATPLADRLARSDEELEQAILQFLVDLNHERAAEEARGKIRYLRPEYQDPNYGKEVALKRQDKLGLDDKATATATPAPVIAEKLTWPKSTSDRVLALKNLLQTLPPDPEVLSPALKGNNTPKRRSEIQDLLGQL